MANELIIVIEDDASLLMLQQRILQLEGFQTKGWNKGAGAYELICEHRPQLVILDLNLEYELAGLDVLRRIRSDNATQQLPVLICCGDASLLDGDAILNHPKTVVVLKPVNPEILLFKLRQLLAS